MDYVIVCMVALTASALTLFSGFGLGTVLMPAFALFFPVPVAVASTALVHLSNNVFKIALVGRRADWGVVIRFALPAAGAAVIGAALLNLIAGMTPVAVYKIGGQIHQVTAVKLIIGVVIIAFAFIDLLPAFEKLAFDRRYLSLGGFISGFFGGLSGNQGALRSAFLINAGLEKEAFVGTGTVAAVIVDVARLSVYGAGFYTTHFAGIRNNTGWLIIAATIAAFLGAFIGSRLMKKITMRTIQLIVGTMLILVGLGMAGGIF